MDPMRSVSHGGRRMRDFFEDIDSIDGMNGRDPMDDFMSRVEQEFFGRNSGLFGIFHGGMHPNY